MAKPKKPRTPSQRTQSAPASSTPKVTATSIPLDQLTEAAMSAVLRAASAQKLQRAPIVIIFHPGFGYGTQPSSGFASTIKPFFTECYRQHMLFMFDLWNSTAV